MMLLRHLQVNGFGCFDDLQLDLVPGLNIIRGPNEAGKSTLHRALLTLLFERTDSSKEDLVKQRRWGRQGMYVLEAVVEHEGRTYQLTKDFEQRQTVLVESGGERLTGRNAEARLAELVGTGSRALYEATASFRQADWGAITSVAQVKDRLKAVLTGGAEGVSAEEVLKELDNRLTDLLRGTRG